MELCSFWHSDGIPEELINFEKKSADGKIMQNFHSGTDPIYASKEGSDDPTLT